MDLDPKLGKIIALAKHGIGGEKGTAIRMVKAICIKQGLEFEHVMSDEEPVVKYTIPFRSRREFHIQIGIASKILDNADGFHWNRYRKEMYVETTPAKYIELMYAIEIYLAAYRKERRKIMRDLPRAFSMKHELWADSAESSSKAMTDKEYEAMMRRAALAEGMENVNLRKGIEG